MIAKAGQEQFEGLAFHDPFIGNVVNHDMREIRLTGNRTERCKLRRRKADNILLPAFGGGHAFQSGLFGAGGLGGILAKLGQEPAAVIRDRAGVHEGIHQHWDRVTRLMQDWCGLRQRKYRGSACGFPGFRNRGQA